MRLCKTYRSGDLLWHSTVRCCEVLRAKTLKEQIMKPLYILLPLLALGACGPISGTEAADRCEERARNAASPTGEARIGVNSEKGVVGGVELTVTSDLVAGRDPQIVYENCVFQLTGEGPVRPLNL